jgi:hypothetical protein
MRALLLLLALLSPGCAMHQTTAQQLVVGLLSGRSLVHFACPDKLPPFILQDVTCPNACGFSCLPGRWNPDHSLTQTEVSHGSQR